MVRAHPTLDPSLHARPSLPAIASIAALAVALVATVLAVPGLAGLAGAQPTTVDGEVNHEVPDFEYDTVQPPCDGETSYAVYSMDDLGKAIDTEIIVDEDPGTEQVHVRFRVPELAGGGYQFERSCPEDGPDGEFPTEQRSFSFSRVLLTKAVEGEVPTGTTFTVNTACAVSGDPFLDEDREFDADGGDDQVVFYQSGENIECTITEPEDGGAQSVAIEPETLTYTEFSDGSSTITNTFPEPSPDPSPSPSVDDTVDEAEPAEPVEAEPDFTG